MTRKHMLTNLSAFALVAIFTQTGAIAGTTEATSPASAHKPGKLSAHDESVMVFENQISREDLKAKLDSGQKVVLVDALEPDYFVLCHIPGSLSIPFADADKSADSKLPDKNAEIVVYCMSYT